MFVRTQKRCDHVALTWSSCCCRRSSLGLGLGILPVVLHLRVHVRLASQCYSVVTTTCKGMRQGVADQSYGGRRYVKVTKAAKDEGRDVDFGDDGASPL